MTDLRERFASLDRMTPPADLWADIERRVAAAGLAGPELVSAGPTTWRPETSVGPSRRLILVLALLALALASYGIAIAGGLVENPLRSDDPPIVAEASAPPIVAPSAATSEADTFVTSTSVIGTIEWTKVDLPQRITPAAQVDGQLIGRDFENDTWWSSSDGTAWAQTARPEPDPLAFVAAGDSNIATFSPDGGSTMMGPASFRQVIARDSYDEPGDAAIMRRGPAGWTEVAIPGSEPPPVSGLVIHEPWFYGTAALDDSNWVAPILRFVEVPWAAILGLPAPPSTAPDASPDPFGRPPGATHPGTDAWPIWDAATQRLNVFRSGEGPNAQLFDGTRRPIVSLIVELVPGDPPTIEFRDAEDRTLVHSVPATLPGWTPEELLEALRGWGLEDVAFVVSSGGEIEVVRPPFPMAEEWTESMGSGIATAFGRYYTMSLTRGAGYTAERARLWESQDGATWIEVPLPDLYPGPLNSVQLAARTDGLIILVDGADDGAVLWQSADGRDFVQVDVDPSDIGWVAATDFGWLVNAIYGSWDRAVVSSDGRTWEAIELPPLPGEPDLQPLGDLLVLGPEADPDGSGYAMWIGRVSP
jgi:hypothetical protein